MGSFIHVGVAFWGYLAEGLDADFELSVLHTAWSFIQPSPDMGRWLEPCNPYLKRKEAERVLQLLVFSAYPHERLNFVSDGLDHKTAQDLDDPMNICPLGIYSVLLHPPSVGP